MTVLSKYVCLFIYIDKVESFWNRSALPVEIFHSRDKSYNVKLVHQITPW